MSTIPHRVTGGACAFLAEFRGELQLVLLIGEGLVSSVEADISRQTGHAADRVTKGLPTRGIAGRSSRMRCPPGQKKLHPETSLLSLGRFSFSDIS